MLDALVLDPFWAWLILACLFLAVEVLIIPAGFFLCLGTSAGVVAAIAFFIADMSWLWSCGIFAVCMIIALFFWLRVMQKRRGAPAAEQNENGEDEADILGSRARQLVGFTGVLESAVQNGRGRMRVNDSSWIAESAEDIPAGTKVEVLSVHGTVLSVRPAPGHQHSAPCPEPAPTAEPAPAPEHASTQEK